MKLWFGTIVFSFIIIREMINEGPKIDTLYCTIVVVVSPPYDQLIVSRHGIVLFQKYSTNMASAFDQLIVQNRKSSQLG